MRRVVLILAVVLPTVGCHRFVVRTENKIVMDEPMQTRVTAEMPPVNPNAGPVRPVVVAAGASSGRVAIVDVDGLLLNTPFVGPLSVGENPVALFRERLDAAEADPCVKAVVVRINSHGGGVAACILMRRDLERFKSRSGKPVVASLLDNACGGAYYLATAADQIVAGEATVTGGLGVILNLFNLQDLMAQFNVIPQPIKAGELADIGKLFARAKDGYDGATPSGNGLMTRNLVRLAAKTGDGKYRELAGKSLRAFAGMLRTSPSAAPNTARALDHWLDTASKEPTAGPPKDPALKAPRESADVVKATATLAEPEANGSRRFSIKLQITAPFHVYSNQVLNPMLDGSKTTVAVFAGGKQIEPVQTFPLGELVKDAATGDYRIYTDGATSGGVLPAGVDPATLEFRVRVVACREGRCLLPSTLRVKP
jgi:hypothetical protein